jgi:hypothetical protein
MKTKRLLPLLAVLCLGLAGCLPESINPIVPMNQTVRDARLDGAWAAREGDTQTFYHFGLREKKGAVAWVDVVGVEHPKDGTLQTQCYGVLPARIGSHTYLSFVPQSALGAKVRHGKFFFARYDFDWMGRLRIYMADEDALVKAVRAGKLHGTVKSSQYGSSVTLTDTSAHIAAFVAASDDRELFGGKPMVLRRK